MVKPVAKAGIYLRISQADDEEESTGIGRQRDDCLKFAADKGFDFVGEYKDDDISASAYSRKKRPEYERLLADLKAGTINTVVVWNQDRLVRQPKDLETFVEVVQRAGARYFTVTGGIEIGGGDDNAMLVARIQIAVAAQESATMSRRIRRKAKADAEDGLWSGGGTRPYGYRVIPATRPAAEDAETAAAEPTTASIATTETVDAEEARRQQKAARRMSLEIIEEEATVIRGCADQILAGLPLRAVVRKLNNQGVPTATGKEWTATTVKRMLCQGVISGQREHQPRSRAETVRVLVGPIVAKGTWPSIITPEQTEQIRGILMDPDRRLTSGTPRRCLLTGILICWNCKQGMQGRPRGDKLMRYCCNRQEGNTRCGKTFVLADPTDDYISRLVVAAFDGPDLGRRLSRTKTPATAALHETVARAKQALINIGMDWDERVITDRNEYKARRAIQQRKIDDAERQLIGSKRASTLAAIRQAGPLSSRWEGMAQDEQRATVAAALQSVTVGPARRGYNRFDDSRFALDWWD